jgi:arsenite-transporting ATPase
MPLPDDLVYDSLNQVLDRLTEMQRILSDPDKSTIRLVLTPEKMVIKEAQRTYTYLNLYGFAVDAVVCNRVIPEDATEGFYARWRDIQAKHMDLIDECFSPIPILKAPLFDEEVLGLKVLDRMADSLFGDSDPSKPYFRGVSHELRKDGEGYLLTLPLPLAAKGDLEMLRHGDELVLRVGAHRRNILLPRAVAGLETRGAKFENGELRISFS